MHMSMGNILAASDYGQLVLIEYLFHITLMLAAGVLALFFVRAIRTRLAQPMGPATATTETSGARA
jgi:hypothetical protein